MSKIYKTIKTTFKSPKCNNCKKEAPIPITTQAGIFCSEKCEEDKSKEFFKKFLIILNDRVAKGDISIEESNRLKYSVTGGYDAHEVEKRAKSFLDGVINKNKNKVMEIKGGWIINGVLNTYFINHKGRVYVFNSDGLPQSVCIVSKNQRYIHQYDVLASRILALINDDKVKIMEEY